MQCRRAAHTFRHTMFQHARTSSRILFDDINRDANTKLTARMMEDSEQLRGYFNLILISRALERVGDHATNIAEDAVYTAVAEDIRHQSVGAST
jgi:phosphate uptake regulator